MLYSCYLKDNLKRLEKEGKEKTAGAWRLKGGSLRMHLDCWKTPLPS
ncbi:hypothetical protein RchiOBHm_Chr6g0285311 [Rosa chinensis]|uniref:Uncharacterized protein n=1 Tax=Rosa chinensis TaxID=74649 RepID=A0A2P6PUI1_ROSCH|nr:hypothetical protein RchiOBHm_Chr6g0285311 [Rosa chinensis]